MLSGKSGYKQAGSIDAREESAIIAYQACLQAEKEFYAELHRSHYLQEESEKKTFILKQRQTSTGKVRLDKVPTIKEVPDFAQTLLQQLIEQLKKMFKRHEQNVHAIVRQLKTVAKRLNIAETKVDEFAAKVEEEVSAALPVLDPATAAAAPQSHTSLKAKDPTADLGFSAFEAIKAVEVKQQKEQKQTNWFSRIFSEAFGSSLKIKEERSANYAIDLELFEQLTRSLFDKRVVHQWQISAHIHLAFPADYHKLAKGTAVMRPT